MKNFTNFQSRMILYLIRKTKIDYFFLILQNLIRNYELSAETNI